MKKAVALTLALATAGIVAVSGFAQQSQVKIQYATWDGTRKAADQKLIAAFEASHPNTKVQYNLVPWDTYWQKAAAMTAGGVTFDVMWMNLDNLPFYVSQGALEPMTLTDTEKKGVPAAMLAPYQTADGKVYGIPLGPQAVSVYINRDLFKKRGIPIPTTAWTWDQVVDASKKLTFTEGGKKYWGINGQDLQTDLEYGMSFFYTFGGQGIIKKTAEGFVPNLDANFKSTSQKLFDLITKYKVAPTPKDVAQQGYQIFLAGQMGIFAEGTWMTAVWPDNPKLNWAFAPFPTLKAGDKPRASTSAHALVIPKGAKEKTAALEFAKWVTTAVPSQRLIAENGLMATNADGYKSQYMKSLPGRNAEVIFDQLKTGVIINSDVRLVSNLPEVLAALNTALNLAWTGNQPLDTAIQKASDDMAKLLKKSKELAFK
jgi:multiple sugar transport system substrate-binding protein